MQYTDNLGLKLPEGTDFYDVDDMNYNSQLIDAAISGSGGTAADISYDNSDSGLSATNVQDAIDEVAQSGGGGGVGTVVNLTTTTPSFHNKTVTLTGTYATYTTTFDNTGHASVNVYYVGTYDIACEGFHNSVNVTAMGLVLTQGIDEDYCTVNITTSIADLEGETIDIYYGTDPTDIRAQLTFDNTLALSFRATQIGDYNIAWTTTTTTTTTFTVSALSGSMNVTFNPIPVGATYTPVNDVLAWVKSGGVLDKNYTTISQVLSDTTTLQTLISSNNANDYLVRSTSWVSNVCGNSTAMSYIGLNNYSANTLLANSTWCNGICNSTYFESVLNVKVPFMTSDTSPSGRVLYSSQFSNDSHAARNVFDGSLNTTWNCAQSEYGQVNQAYVGYMFPSAVKILFARVIVPEAGRSNYNYQLIGSNNGISWTEISAVNTASTYSGWNPVMFITSPTTRQYYGVRGSQMESGNTYAQLNEVQFYGRQDV